MKKIILLSISILYFTSCNMFNSKDTTAITSIVTNVESIVNKYDNNVQSYIDSKRFSYIENASTSALDSVRINLNQLIILELPSKQEKLRESAISYIESLQEVIHIEKSYASLSDSTTLDEAKILDQANSKAIEIADKEHKRYVDQLNALK